MNFRRGTAADLDVLHDLAIRSYAEFANVLAPEHWADLDNRLRNKEDFADLLSRSTSFVCEVDGNAAGAAYIVPSGNPAYVFRADWSYIRMVGVAPEYRGKGISRLLTEACIDYARSTGEHTIALHTSEFMNAARHIYESLGFEQQRELEPLFGKRYWLYLLRLC